MFALSLTLLTDGSSDRILLPLIERLMDAHCHEPYVSRFAEGLPAAARTTAERIRAAIDLFPCDLLFVHRDAESVEPASRADEIRRSMPGLPSPPYLVCVIPVRMTETWLLTNEAAIRAAVGNPGGTADLSLPSVGKLESSDAKLVLLKALETAKEWGQHRARRFRPERYRHRIVELTPDLTGLRKLPSFQRLEADVVARFSS